MTRALIIGAGGLGGPIAYALAAAGVELTVCDDDVVELSNLQRQIQFISADIGRPKVAALMDEMARRGHERASIRAVAERFDDANASALVADADIIVDGSDDFATKFAVNDRALAFGMPVVIAAALHYTGQIFALDPRADESREQGCYRCLFEGPPEGEEAEGQSCAQTGVFGATVAFIGGLAASAAIALLNQGGLFSSGSRGGLWLVDDIRTASVPWPTRTSHYAIRPDCPACLERAATLGSRGENNHPEGALSWHESESLPH